MSISIAMCTYNGERYLREQLDSLSRQTCRPLELVICDDGSTDKTLQIIQDFTATAPFPVYLHVNPTNLGYADNFLKAAGLCQGEWVAFSDQDDVWMPEKIERVEQVIKQYGDDDLVMVGHTSLLSDAQLSLTGERIPDFRHDRIVPVAFNHGFFCIVGFSMVCRARLIRGFKPELRSRMSGGETLAVPGHDQWLSMLANALGKIAYISTPLAIWRRHIDTTTRPVGTKPPEEQNIIVQSVVSRSALNPAPYLSGSNRAKDAEIALRNLSRLPDISQPDAERLESSANKFSKLSRNLFFRSQLYGASNRIKKLKLFLSLVKMNAYFENRFSTLGWKAFLKDGVFSLGLL